MNQLINTDVEMYNLTTSWLRWKVTKYKYVILKTIFSGISTFHEFLCPDDFLLLLPAFVHNICILHWKNGHVAFVKSNTLINITVAVACSRAIF